RLRSHDQPQRVRQRLLHPGRLSRFARERGGGRHAPRAELGPGPPRDGCEPRRRGVGLVVLAFRGWRLGRGVHGGLCGGQVKSVATSGSLVATEQCLTARWKRMATEPHTVATSEGPGGPNEVEMPRPTVAPLTVSLGAALVGIGVATSLTFLVVGAIVLATGLG